MLTNDADKVVIMQSIESKIKTKLNELELKHGIVDCFKFRNKIGINVVLEALTFYKERKKFNPSKLIKYAKICRVENVMKPYIESIASKQ